MKEFFGREYSFDNERDSNNAFVLSTKCNNSVEFEIELGNYMIDYNVEVF